MWGQINMLYFKVTFTYSRSKMRKFHRQGNCFLPQSNNMDFQEARRLLKHFVWQTVIFYPQGNINSTMQLAKC